MESKKLIPVILIALSFLALGITISDTFHKLDSSKYYEKGINDCKNYYNVGNEFIILDNQTIEVKEWMKKP